MCSFFLNSFYIFKFIFLRSGRKFTTFTAQEPSNPICYAVFACSFLCSCRVVGTRKLHQLCLTTVMCRKTDGRTAYFYRKIPQRVVFFTPFLHRFIHRFFRKNKDCPAAVLCRLFVLLSFCLAAVTVILGMGDGVLCRVPDLVRDGRPFIGEFVTAGAEHVHVLGADEVGGLRAGLCDDLP